jgi:hypothetical protein
MDKFKTIFRHLKESIKSLIMNIMSIIFAPVDAIYKTFVEKEIGIREIKLIKISSNSQIVGRG